MVENTNKFGIDDVEKLLRQQGQRLTRKRRGILQCLLQAKQPLALQDIQNGTQAVAGLRPDYATVFRLVTLLEKLKLVHRVNLQRACTYFEFKLPSTHHDHLVCRACGSVVVLDIPCPVREAEKNICQQYGFRDLSHSLEFFGVCPQCAV